MEQKRPRQKNPVVVWGTIGAIVGALGGVVAIGPHSPWWMYPIAFIFGAIGPAMAGMFIGALYREIKRGR
jgi:hypothetical protein